MSLVHSQTESGLHVMSAGADERAVANALRDYDRDLRLIPQDSDAHGRRIYKVYRYCGPDRRAEFLFVWGDDYGNPFPLSMAILDRVKQLDKNTRHENINEDEWNARLKARIDRDFEATSEDIKDEELRRKGKSYAFAKSEALAFARIRGRRKGITYDSWGK